MRAEPWGAALSQTWEVLSRSLEIDMLAFLPHITSVTRPVDPRTTRSRKVAIGFDTSSIFHLALGGSGADMLDYLASKHAGPLILPGQVVQEVWNNQVVAIPGLADILSRKIADIRKEAQRIVFPLSASVEKVQSAIAELSSDFDRAQNEETRVAFESTIELMRSKASVPYVPRIDFHQLAVVRHETRTPPGFKDDRHGDFFVWSDFLYGLARVQDSGLECAVFVTDDVKSDWSRAGHTHPVLLAEAAAVGKVPFELWSLSDLKAYVTAQVRTGR